MIRYRHLTAIICFMVVGLAASVSKSQDYGTNAATLEAEATKAYQAKDYARFLTYEKRVLELQPTDARLVYNVACGEALTGNAAEAVRRLDQLIDRKLDLGAENDGDFASIRKTPEWTAFEKKLSILRKPVIHSTVAFRLDDPDLVATGIAVDSRTGDTYIASVRERKIVRRTRAGVVSDFITEGQDGFLAGASLAIDAPGHLLMASTAAVPFMTGYRKEDFGTSGLFAFDLKSGKLVRKVMLPPNGKLRFLNALAVDREGTVYVSDSGQSGIYRLRRGAEQLEVFIQPSVFRAAQGLALSDDEKTLYVADYSNGVWALDIASKERRHLDAPADAWLTGLDGLSRVGRDLIAVQIGVGPQRVLRLRLESPAKQAAPRIAKVELLEMNHPDYDGPIQGVVANGAFFYVANSQLSLANPQTGAFATDRARPTVVLRLPL